MSMNEMNVTRKNLLRWCGWFFLGNVLLYWVIGFKYLQAIAWLNTDYLNLHHKISLVFFLGVSYIGQFALLALSPALLIIPLLYIFPRRHFILITSAVIAGILAALLLTDAFLYSLYRYHLNGIMLDLVLHSAHEQFLDLSLTEIILCVTTCVGLLLVEVLWAYWLWYRLIKRPFLVGMPRWIALVLGLSLYISYSMILFTTHINVNRIFIEAARVLPFYTEILGAMLPMQHGQIALERAFEKYVVQPAQASEQMHYPLQPLKFATPKHHLNVLIICVDTWRFDMLNPIVTPNLYQFAKESWVYTHHFSGGNATGPGIYSLFYGLPATYWTATEVQKQGPVLIDEFKKRHYQMKMLASAGLTLPPFNKTVFLAIENAKLKLPGKDPYERDLSVTREFKKFIDRRTTREPFFSFLFYDAAHSYCAVPNSTKPFKPSVKKCDRFSLTWQSDPKPYFNRYKNSLQLVDTEVGEVLHYLKAHQLLDNTVVIITGDHGEEFNDNHLGYWGHASNFTHYQVQTPLIIHWPNQKPKTVSQFTTHFDIAPTLMEKILGCKTPANAYSIGNSLFNEKPYPYLIVGSYIGFGIVESKRITSVFPTGNFIVTKIDGNTSPDLKLDAPLMQSVFQEMRRFYQR